MRIKFLLLAVVLCSTSLYGQWKPVGDKIKTSWADEIDPKNVLPNYPRPIMERGDWLNLNGLWSYAVLPVGEKEPKSFDGQILVPFAIESSLSGVQKMLGKENELWYNREFTIPSAWKNRDILLHFGAVDWRADVFINDIKIGTHTGGFTPFYFNISPYLTSGQQKLTVKVWDPTSDSYIPRGKQVTKPEHIWYTPVSGIWQTVWIEPVSHKHIKSIVSTPDIDKSTLRVEVSTENTAPSDILQISIKDGERVVSKVKYVAGEAIDISIPNAKLWSPESPFLYDIEVALIENNRKEVDKVSSYAAMRKISQKKDVKGYIRFQLNNKDYFHFGLLDQGWWPDGLYTAPTDDALVSDIIKTKEWGYNMIRKHVKTEPARWYTYCDRLGILVWQDMPNGDESPKWEMHNYFSGVERKISNEADLNFKKEWKEIIDYLKPYPSIVVWVPFNEAWGQFKTVEISEWTKNYDPSRLVNSASGGNHYKTGDILDYHKYPSPELMMLDLDRATVIGEYGGIGLPIQGHLWQTDRNWGYTQFKNAKEVTDEYIKYADELLKLISQGISGAVYTQTTDVEGEVNGILTYDRKVLKIEKDRFRNANLKVCNSLSISK